MSSIGPCAMRPRCSSLFSCHSILAPHSGQSLSHILQSPSLDQHQGHTHSERKKQQQLNLLMGFWYLTFIMLRLLLCKAQEHHLNPVIVVFIGKLPLSILRCQGAMCQGFIIFHYFCIILYWPK